MIIAPYPRPAGLEQGSPRHIADSGRGRYDPAQRVTAVKRSGLRLPERDGEYVPVFYKIDKDRRLVMSSGSGVLTVGVALAYMDLLSKDPDFDPEFSQVSDFTQFTGIDLSPEDVRQLARRNIFSPRSRRAFVVKNDLQFGLARMFQIHRELNGEMGIRVFRTIDEALDWVLVGNAAS